MSDIERIEQAAGLHPSAMGTEVQRAPRRRLSRGWFDVLVLLCVGVSLASTWLLHIWPVGCADDDVKARAAASIKQQAVGATAASLHLIGKVSRASRELHCKAFSRVEFADRPYEHRGVDYVVHMNRAGNVVDVSVTLRDTDR